MQYKRKHAPKCKMNWDDLLKLSIENLKTCQRNDKESHAQQSSQLPNCLSAYTHTS